MKGKKEEWLDKKERKTNESVCVCVLVISGRLKDAAFPVMRIWGVL